MKKMCWLIILLVLLFGQVVGADGWVVQGVTAEALYDVTALAGYSGRVGLAAGASGLVAATSNFGGSWHYNRFGTHNLNGVVFFSTLEGYVVGASNTFGLATYESGATQASFNFSSLSGPGAGLTLNGLYTKARNLAWAAGDYFVTSNSVYKYDGNTWTKKVTGIGEQCHFNKIAFAADDATKGWLAGGKTSEGEKVIYTSANSGETWTKASLTAPGTGYFNGLQVLATTDVWAVGDGGKIFHYDGSWSDLSSTTIGTINLAGVYFASATAGWVVGPSGQVFKTINGGTSWTAETMPSGASSYGLNAIAGTAETTWIAGAGSGALFAYALSPTVTTVSPARINSSTEAQTALITVEGTRFHGLAGIVLTPVATFASTALNVNQVNYIDSTKLQLTLAISADATAGTYDLIVTNPDGGAVTKANALEVLPSSLVISRVLIDGQQVVSGQVTIDQRDWQNSRGPVIQVTVTAPTPIGQASQVSVFAVGLSLTGEAAINSITDILTFEAAANVATAEVQHAVSLEGGATYSGTVNVYWGNQQASQALSIIVSSTQPSPQGTYRFLNPLPSQRVIPESGGQIEIQGENAGISGPAEAKIIGGGGPAHIYSQDVNFDQTRIRAQAAGDLVLTSIKVTVPSGLARGVYQIRFYQNGVPVSAAIPIVISN